MHTHRTALLAALAGTAAAPQALADTINVPAEAPTIQIAINLSSDGDEIVVAPGTYFESLTLLGKEVTLRSSGGPGATTIDGFGQFDSVIHAVSGETLNTVIDGFTITGGNADGIDDGDPVADERGGGLFVNGSSVTVVNCMFIDNVAANVGGAFYSNGGTASFTDCLFEDNQADLGGGTYINGATATFTDCDFVANDALTSSGGGMRSISSTTSVTRCRFEGNTTLESGGGIDFTGNLTVNACSFVANDALNGGAIFASGTATVRDSLVNGNSATNSGGGVYVNGSGNVTMVNATVVHNFGSGTALWNAGGTASLTNCIFWANVSNALGGSAVTVAYSVVAGGTGTNIDADPLFVDAAGGDTMTGTADDDLRLQAGSPAIDSGNSSAVTGQYPVDLDGNPRALDDPDTADTGLSVLGLAVDMGAYELQPTPSEPPCPGDINGDNAVNVSDLLVMLGAWGGCP